MSRPNVDATPSSAFVREMRAALRQRLQTSSAAEKRRIDGEMRDIMRRHLGPGAWQAIQEAAARPVPRATSRRWRAAPSHAGYGAADRKLAAAGPDDDA